MIVVYVLNSLAREWLEQTEVHVQSARVFFIFLPMFNLLKVELDAIVRFNIVYRQVFKFP